MVSLYICLLTKTNFMVGVSLSMANINGLRDGRRLEYAICFTEEHAIDRIKNGYCEALTVNEIEYNAFE